MYKKISIIIILSFLVSACGGNASNLNVGDKAPEFELEDHLGTVHALSDYRDKSPVVVYFYPKAGTKGCTEQACGVRDSYPQFEEKGIAVFGISVDSKEEIASFVEENSLNFPLLSDSDKTVVERYGVLNNVGLANRITFIIDKSGHITYILREVDIETHADLVLDMAKKLI